MKASLDGFSKYTLAEGSAPGMPDSGLLYVYAKTDGKLYTKNDGGVEICLSEKLVNPMSAAGDTIYGGASGTPTRLAKGTASQILRVNAGETAPEWATEAVADYELLVSWAHSVDVASVDLAIPAGSENNFSVLQVLMHIRTDRAANAMEGMKGRLSTGASYDTGNNYWAREVETGDGNFTDSSATNNAFYLGRAVFPGATADANVFGYGEFMLTGWDATSGFTNLRGHSFGLVSSSNYRHDECYGMWKNTGVVDGIRIFTANSSKMIAGSWIKVYGMAKA